MKTKTEGGEKMKNHVFKKFIYLAAVQIILISQLLVIANALIATPILAESGSGSDGQVVTQDSTSGSDSGSPSTENTGSGTSGSNTNPTDESAGAIEQATDTTNPNTADGSNSGSGSSTTQDSATTDTQSNSGTGNGGDTQATTDQQVAPTTSGEVTTETGTITTEITAPAETTVTEGTTTTTGTDVPTTVTDPATTTPTTDVATTTTAPAEAEAAGTGPGTATVGVDAPVIGEAAPADAATTTGTTTTGPTDGAIGSVTPTVGVLDANGFPLWYQDSTGTALALCTDSTDPKCILPAAGQEANFDPNQPTVYPSNFPSESFYWNAVSDKMETPNGGKVLLVLALEAAFANGDVVPGDQITFGRIRVTGTNLEPNATYIVTHPYGVDTYTTDEGGTLRRNTSTQDVGCAGKPCNFADALQSSVLQSFLRWDSGAPLGYLGDAVTPHTVTGSPTGNNFFKIEGPGLGAGLLTNLFTIAGKLFTGEVTAPTEPVVTPTDGAQAPALPQQAAVGEVDQTNGFPVSYTDGLGNTVVPCLDGTDPKCILPAAGDEPGFDPAQPTQLGVNFPSEFFYWIAESDKMATPLGGKVILRTALEGAFANGDPIPGDQMVFGRIRVTGTGLEPNAQYLVTHPYGVDVYTTDERGILRRNTSTQDVGCAGKPCNFAEALQSPVFGGFLQSISAPAGYLGDAVTLTQVTGSPLNQNFFRIEGPGLPLGGLFTDLFTVAGKLLGQVTSSVTGVIGGVTDTPDTIPTDVVPVPDPVAPAEGTAPVDPALAEAPAEVAENEVVEPVEQEAEGVVAGDPAVTTGQPTDVVLQLTTTEALASAQPVADNGASTNTASTDNSTSQQSNNQSQPAVSGNSDNSSNGGSSNSSSDTTGSEAEQRGAVAEGERAGVSEGQIAADGISDDNSQVLAAFAEDNSENVKPTAVSTEKKSQSANVDPLEILLALAAFAIAGGLMSASAIGSLNLKRYLRFNRVLRFR